MRKQVLLASLAGVVLAASSVAAAPAYHVIALNPLPDYVRGAVGDECGLHFLVFIVVAVCAAWAGLFVLLVVPFVVAFVACGHPA